MSTTKVPVGHTAAVTLVEASRRGVLAVENESTQVMYVLEGAGASVDLHTVSLMTGDYWESPLDADGNVYQGKVTARLAEADETGHAMVTVR